MIELSKGPKPKWLEDNQARKTEEYRAAEGTKPSPWRAREIVDALKDECARKCMYCEGIIDDVSYSAVEHILPKDEFEDLVLDWNNLGLVCGHCNSSKGNYWTANPSFQLLNPYQDPISEHIGFAGPQIVAKLGSTRGENTLRKLKFSSRIDLFMSRVERIQDLHSRLDNWYRAEESEMKELLAEDIEEAISNTKEFSAALRAYAISQGFPAAKDENSKRQFNNGRAEEGEDAPPIKTPS